uniref:Dynactin subunit 5 n=1 Tax=Trieres chinensis TaxID=1514140 RepID=A0A7S1ZJQ9_TRICV
MVDEDGAPSQPAEQLEAEEGYIKTAANNYVSRSASIHGSRHVEIRGKSVVRPGAVVRGDLGAPVRVGRYCRVGDRSVLRPPSASLPDGTERRLPQSIGNHTSIGRDCVVEAAAVGFSVLVGDGCVLGKRSVIKDCCRIEPGTVLAPDAVVPPFSIVSGSPGRVVGEMPESAAAEIPDRSLGEYAAFVKERREEELSAR